MPEERVPADVFEIRYRCDECGEGFMQIRDDQKKIINPGEMLHVCSNCGYERVFSERYPDYEFVVKRKY